jgi:subtilisin family serine protease
MPTPQARRREPCQIGPLAIVALAATAVVLVLAGRGGGASAAPPVILTGVPAAWSGFVGEQRAQVAFGQRQLVVLREPSLGDRVARAGGLASDVQERRWTREAFSKQRELISRLALQGVVVEPEFSYARVLNGFSAALDAQAVALLEKMPQVKGLYPVRAVYPASTPLRPLPDLALEPGRLGSVTLPGFTGRGVTIALLDTGVDRAHPLLAGRVREGYDVVDGDRAAIAEARPGDPGEVERHGTEVAGLLTARPGRSSGPRGVVPGAAILPVRVAGWQRDAAGEWAVYGRTDQLIAGLERAVDPNGDGDAHDAARIVLVGVAEPFAAFSAGPSARAVSGAADLDALVVVPAGNDGPAGPAFGSVGGPGGAPEALTVGAADLRRTTADVPVVVRAGLRVLIDQRLPLVGAIAPRGPMTLRVAAARSPTARSAEAPTAPPTLADFFAVDGTSLVAGRAALVAGRSAPGLAAENAVAAGAHAVLLSGGRAPAGALGLGESVSVPVVALPAAVARAALAAIKGGAEVTAAIGPGRLRAGAAGGSIADFSSRGLAFDGRVKPDLVAPGVALATLEPGTDEHGTPHLGTLNGSSAATALVAGAAAALAQARPELGASALKSLLVGSTTPLANVPLAAQGAGLVDLGAAAAGELSLEPASVAFGSVRPGRTIRQTVVVRNISTRRLRVRIAVSRLGGAANIRVRALRRRLALRPGAAVAVALEADVSRRPGGATAAGELVVVPAAGTAQRVPWALTIRPTRTRLLSGARLSTHSFEPSDTAPAVLTLRAGRFVLFAGGVQIEPVARLDVELWSEKGKKIGRLARLRDLLPIRLAFGLTGRGPGGQVLDKGLYRLVLVAAPPGNGPPTRRTLAFRIE